MTAAFWRFAHTHYHSQPPSSLTDIAALGWALFFVLIYGAALLAGWWPNVAEAVVGISLAGVPLAVGLAHRRVRLEAAKGPDALYRKRLATNR